MTTTLLALEKLFSEAIGDWIEFDTSTNITTGSTARIVATTLNNYDGAADDYFNDWWAYITEGNNSGKVRKVKNYETSAGRLDLYGSAFAAESSAVTCRLHRFDRRNKTRAMNRAIEQLYPAVHKKLEDRTLVTANILPDNSFELWTSATAMSFYSTSNATLARTTTAGFLRGMLGTTSMKVTASAAGGYAYISSDTYPRLLDLMGQTIDFKCWAYPEVAADAVIEIYTKQADGTAQTLSSTTANPAGEYSLLELEEQTLNDDLVEIQIRFKVTTNAKYVYFDSARVIGINLYEYLLLSDFDDGHVSEVRVQTSGYSDDICDDLTPRHWSDPLQFRTLHDGTYLYLRLREAHSANRQIRVIGYAPLEALSADADTISLDGEKLNLIVAQAAYNLYQMERGTVSAQDKGRYDQEMAYWTAQIRRLRPTLEMMRPTDTVYTGL